MRHFWVYLICPLLLHGAEPSSAQELETLPTGPKPFPSSHYSLIQEYSPFVKSMESAKETEKSPDLVVVGYGRMKGEDQVIVQQKENSEKREKIGNRFGSKDFPYRLLAVTNISDRKTFVATLEDRNKKKYQIRYASESSGSPGVASGAGSPVQPPPGGANVPPAALGGKAGFVGRPPILGTTLESLPGQIEKLEANVNDPNLPDSVRQVQMRILETKKRQLEALQAPQDLPSPEVTPEPAP